MNFFCDFLIYICLFTSGFHNGYYLKYTYTYRNLWMNWFILIGVVQYFLFAIGWTWRKYIKRKYLYENFYIVFYGLICSIISAVFLLNESIVIAFCFIFMSMVTTYLPCYNYISLRCDSYGSRPARISFGNTLYYLGVAAGFTISIDLELKRCAWILFGISLFATVCVIINELLQQYHFQDYKSSFDLVYNLLNEEKLIYVPRKSILTLFVGRDDYCFKRNIQWLVVGLTFVVLLERSSLYSFTYMSLFYRSSHGYLHRNCVYIPYLLYASGCALGSLLMLRYKPKLVYLIFGLIKLTITASILGVYNNHFSKYCFILLCIYYVSTGVYSSIGIQMLVEYSPFLYTELTLAASYILELTVIQIAQLEVLNANPTEMKNVMVSTMMIICITFLSICLVQCFLMDSVGLIELRNRLLGIHRLPVKSYENRLYKKNFFLQMEIPTKASSVILENDYAFHQYPTVFELKTKF